MLVEKIFSATLNFEDPNGYCTAAEHNLLTRLRQRFEGRCRKGAYIVRVLEVVRYSGCRLRDTDLSAQCSVDVQFRAEVSIVSAYDIVSGVVIEKRSQLMIGRSTVEGSVIVNLLATPEAETVREGQTVSVRVLKTLYNADQPQVTAAGALLTCDKAAPVYLVEAGGQLTAEDARALAPLVGRIKDLLAARAALAETRSGDLAFFETLLYSFPGAGEARDPAPETHASADAAPWVGPASHPLPDGTTAVNLLDAVGSALEGGLDVSGLWSRDLVLRRSCPLAARADPRDAPPHWAGPVAASPRMALNAMLKTVYEFLKAVNDMAAIYNTPEMIASHKNIWLVMRGSQLPLRP